MEVGSETKYQVSLNELIVNSDRAYRAMKGADVASFKDPKNDVLDARARELFIKAWDLRDEVGKRIGEEVVSLGFPEVIPEGHLRVYRGVQWPWERKHLAPNQYWTQKPEVALFYAANGDLVCADIPEGSLYRVVDLEKRDELQLTDPKAAELAKIVLRNRKLVRPDRLPSPTLTSLMHMLLKTAGTQPKDYSMLHDEWIALGGSANPD